LRRTGDGTQVDHGVVNFPKMVRRSLPSARKSSVLR
jgi:hypothetical protein